MSRTLFQRLRDGQAGRVVPSPRMQATLDAVPGDPLRELRESIRENLCLLLNSRWGMSEAEPEYGLPDLIDILWSESGFGPVAERKEPGNGLGGKPQKATSVEWTDHGSAGAAGAHGAAASAKDTPENIQRGIKAIVRSIRKYEPRLSDVEVKLSRSAEAAGTAQTSLSFEISGKLQPHLGGQLMRFETVISNARPGLASPGARSEQIGVNAK